MKLLQCTSKQYSHSMLCSLVRWWCNTFFFRKRFPSTLHDEPALEHVALLTLRVGCIHTGTQACIISTKCFC